MRQKLIVFDVDGTLLDAHKRLPDSAKEAIGDLQKAGHAVAIATGRTPMTFAWLREELAISSYISANGQYVVHHGEAIYRHPHEPAILERLADYADKREHPLIYLTLEDWYAAADVTPQLQAAIASLEVKPDIIHQPDAHQTQDVYQVMLFCKDSADAAYQQAFHDLTFMRWHSERVDVIPAGGSKAAGIQQLRERLGIFPADVYAFGDGLNDIEMLRAAPNSVAMGNAADVVKDAASTVTTDVCNDGIWHALKNFRLL